MHQNIHTQPTYDLTEFTITKIEIENNLIYCQSNQVFKFDKVRGSIVNRSRNLRSESNESKQVESIISAEIDSGFCGKIRWKIKITNKASFVMEEAIKNSFEKVEKEYKEMSEKEMKLAIETIYNVFAKELATELKNTAQLSLHSHPTNWYKGSNQTELEPDLTFVSE
jgi:hypothetical protein